MMSCSFWSPQTKYCMIKLKPNLNLILNILVLGLTWPFSSIMYYIPRMSFIHLVCLDCGQGGCVATSLGWAGWVMTRTQQPGSETRPGYGSEIQGPVIPSSSPTSHADTIWNKRGIIYSIPDLLWFIPWCCLEHGHDDNVHIYVYIISTTRTMSPASAPLHTYVLRAWLSWLLMRGERGEWLEGPPWGSSQQATHLTAKFRKLRDELQRGNKERGVETKTLCCHFMSLLNWFKYFFYLA